VTPAGTSAVWASRGLATATAPTGFTMITECGQSAGCPGRTQSAQVRVRILCVFVAKLRVTAGGIASTRGDEVP